MIDQWGKQFQVSSRNVFRLIEHVGEDCAGAIQFISEANEHTLLNQPYSEQVQWLSDGELNERIRLVLDNHASQRLSNDIGQFSLAGAQAKIALYQSKSLELGVSHVASPRPHTFSNPRPRASRDLLKTNISAYRSLRHSASPLPIRM